MPLKNIIPTTFVSLSLMSTVFLSTRGFDEESVRIIIRITAQISVVLFALAFSSSSLNWIWPSKISKFLLKYRPHIGLAFGTTHFIHLLILIILQLKFHPVFELAKSVSLIGGGIAYFCILVMMVTTFPRIQKQIKQWRILHVIGSYWIWIIFFNSYFKNVFNKNDKYEFFLLLVVVLLLRLFSSITKRKVLLSP